MESFLQKWGWIGHLLVIAVAAILLATAFNKYVAIHLAPFTVPQTPEFAKKSGPTKKSAPKPRARSYADAIVKRCLFGCEEETAPASECPDGCADGEVCQDGTCVPEADDISPETLVASDLGVKLLGAMVAGDAEYSVALFADEGAKASYILGVEDSLLGEAEIIDIRRDRVIIRRNGRFEYIKLEDSLGGAPTLTSAVANLPPGATDIKRTPTIGRPANSANPPKKEAEQKVQAKEAPVKKISENEFELDRASVEAELNNPQKLAQGAKVVPNYKDGKQSGIKLVGVRGDSVYKQLGIESGDVVQSINGVAIKNQAHAFELMQGLKNAKTATIEVERRGKSQKMKYSVK